MSRHIPWLHQIGFVLAPKNFIDHLISKSKYLHPPPQKDEILDVQDLRKMLHISYSTYKRRIQDGTLVPKEIGGKDYFLRSEIKHLIGQRKKKKPK